MTRDWNISFLSYFLCPSQRQCLSNELMHCSLYLLLNLYYFLAIKLGLFLRNSQDWQYPELRLQEWWMVAYVHGCGGAMCSVCFFVFFCEVLSFSFSLLNKMLAVFTKEPCTAPPQALRVLPSSPKANNWNGNEGTIALRSASESNETSHYFNPKTHTANVLYALLFFRMSLGKGSIFLPLDSCVSDHIKRQEQKTAALYSAINASRWAIDTGLNEQTPSTHHRKSIVSWESRKEYARAEVPVQLSLMGVCIEKN